MKIGFTVFHSSELDDNGDRFSNFTKIINSFSGNADYIDSEVFIVKSLKDYRVIKKQNKQFFNIRFNGLFRLGAVGLAMTTFNFFNKVKDLDYDYFIVLEDDAQIYNHSFETIKQYINELPEDADILSLYDNPFFYQKYVENVHGIGLKNICLVYNRLSTLGYVISKKGVLKYLDYMNRNIDNPVDLFFFDSNKSTFQYSISPNSKQVLYSDFFRKDNGEPIDDFSIINQTKEFLFNE